MFNFTSIFENKTAIFCALQKFGFTKNNGSFIYKVKILENFLLIITINKNSNVTVTLEDKKYNKTITNLNQIADNYIKSTIEEECKYYLNLISEFCFIINSFTLEKTKKIIEHIFNVYGDTPNFYWQDINILDKAIFVNSQTNLTYAVLQKVDGNILGRTIEVLNVKLPSQEVQKIIDNKFFFVCDNMNKDYWLTIPLTTNIPFKSIKILLEISYNLAQNNLYNNVDNNNFERETAIKLYSEYQKICPIAHNAIKQH